LSPELAPVTASRDSPAAKIVNRRNPDGIANDATSVEKAGHFQ
jgi:hypothetical protein